MVPHMIHVIGPWVVGYAELPIGMTNTPSRKELWLAPITTLPHPPSLTCIKRSPHSIDRSPLWIFQRQKLQSI